MGPCSPVLPACAAFSQREQEYLNDSFTFWPITDFSCQAHLIIRDTDSIRWIVSISQAWVVSFLYPMHPKAYAVTSYSNKCLKTRCN